MVVPELLRDPRIEGLERFGYTAREAAFLTLAALHSGYFLRRQYAQFLGRSPGGTVAAMIEKALALEHARACTYVGNVHVYHLCARPFYAALAQGDNRNRRDRRPFTIKTKLMCLDFVLAHPSHQYLATERAKVEYFTGVLKLDRAVLPTRVFHAHRGVDSAARYFVEKYPIYLAPAPQGGDSELAFGYVDAGATSLSGFETFLDHYRPLFAKLASFRVVYIATRAQLLRAAERTFHRFRYRTGSETTLPDVTAPAHLRVYFETRFLYETGQFELFDRTKLIALRDDRMQFSGPKTEALYASWRSAREHAGAPLSEQRPIAPAPLSGAFSVCVLENNYDVFGDLNAF